MMAGSEGEGRRLAVVTGTSSGIGRALAAQLLDRGWSVLGIARRPAEFDHAGYQHLRWDLADITALPALEDTMLPRLTEASVRRVALVNNAASVAALGAMTQVEPAGLLEVYAINTVAPLWLMRIVVTRTPVDIPLRIVNVSTGAATNGYPGLGAYGSSKAALRLAGMALGAELDSPQRLTSAPADTSILSYEPGIVDTPMQEQARAQPRDAFPWGMFRDFHARGMLVSANRPAAEIVHYVETNGHATFSEKRLGS